MKRPESDLRVPRNEAIYETYKKILREKPDLSKEEIVKEILNSKQPRMWVSFFGVYRTLLRIVYHSRSAPRNKSRQTLEEDVRVRYERLRSKRAFKNASLYFLTSFIISEPATGFYMSPSRVAKTIGEVRKQHQRQWKKALWKD